MWLGLENRPMTDVLRPADLQILRSAASSSADGATVALVFATSDFAGLLLNWAVTARRAGVRWFVLVAMDDALHRQLAYTWSDAPVLLLPRVASSAVKIDKINVIGERQRFGASVLAAGLSVVHSDADALWRADPTPLLSDGDVVASRIWGKPKSVVSAWGAGMCTGFYFVRSSSAAVELAREIQSRVAAKAAAHASWQTSDQFYLNVVLHERGVVWRGGKRMAGLDDFNGRMHSLSRHVGVAGGANRSRRLRLTMLPHALVPRACPVVKASDAATRAGRNKLALWKSVLTTATVLHCFPPGGDPAPGEKRNIMMGHPRHTAAEERFARSQSLWLLRDDWASVARGPSFERWIAALDNRSAGAQLPPPTPLPREDVWEMLAKRAAGRRVTRT